MRMMVAASVALGIAIACAACGESGTGSGLTPVVPGLKTETFTGTVLQGGSSVNTFVAAGVGEVDITLTAAGPPATIVMGLGIGQPATTGGNTCVLFTSSVIQTPAGTSPQISGTAPAAGTYCVQVFDVGNQTGPVNYTLTVSHL
jgi:hypothetical protein